MKSGYRVNCITLIIEQIIRHNITQARLVIVIIIISVQMLSATYRGCWRQSPNESTAAFVQITDHHDKHCHTHFF